MKTTPYLGLRSLIYNVTDIDKAKAWYTQVLGKAPYYDEHPYVGFNVGGFELGLFAVDTNDSLGGAHGYWGVNDIDAEYERLLSLGATAHSPVTDVGGGIRLGTVVDPFKNIFGIIDNPDFEIE